MDDQIGVWNGEGGVETYDRQPERDRGGEGQLKKRGQLNGDSVGEGGRWNGGSAQANGDYLEKGVPLERGGEGAPQFKTGGADQLFSKPFGKQFEFDERVASVFDDMIQRSVPLYWENINLQVEILKRFLKPGDLVVDLGCSTGNFLLRLGKEVPGLRLIGIDNSRPMLERARLKGEALGVPVQWVEGDFFHYQWDGAAAVVANYTLQFVRPIRRGGLVSKIYRSLAPNGLFLAAEKIISGDSWFNRVMIEIYFQYKRQMGYSDYEIAQKREALENVLIPYTLEENLQLLREGGFNPVETILQWNNFATFVGFKRQKT